MSGYRTLYAYLVYDKRRLKRATLGYNAMALEHACAVTMSLLKFEKSSPPPQPPQTFPSQVYRVRQDELGQADHVTGLRFVLNGMHFAGILDSGESSRTSSIRTG